jgi:hypothetical protein
LAESAWNSIAISGEQDDPKQAVAVFRAGLDVGREISRIHVGDRGDNRRAGESQIGAQPAALPGQDLPRRRDRLVGQRRAPHHRLVHIMHEAPAEQCSISYTIGMLQSGVNGTRCSFGYNLTRR